MSRREKKWWVILEDGSVDSTWHFKFFARLAVRDLRKYLGTRATIKKVVGGKVNG